MLIVAKIPKITIVITNVLWNIAIQFPALLGRSDPPYLTQSDWDSARHNFIKSKSVQGGEEC